MPIRSWHFASFLEGPFACQKQQSKAINRAVFYLYSNISDCWPGPTPNSSNTYWLVEKLGFKSPRQAFDEFQLKAAA